MSDSELNQRWYSLGHAVFNTEDGKEWLNIAINKFLIDTPVAPATKDEAWARVREGENGLVRLIKNMGKGINK